MLNAYSNVLNLPYVSTAAAGVELTMRRLQDGRYTNTATAEAMRIKSRRDGPYCIGSIPSILLYKFSPSCTSMCLS